MKTGSLLQILSLGREKFIKKNIQECFPFIHVLPQRLVYIQVLK
jgi:hypothetical protein